MGKLFGGSKAGGTDTRREARNQRRHRFGRVGCDLAIASQHIGDGVDDRRADDDAKLPDGAEEFFELLPGGRVLDVRLAGDDTPDWNRVDAMVPIRGQLAVLRRRRGGRR